LVIDQASNCNCSCDLLTSKKTMVTRSRAVSGAVSERCLLG